jgi:two-component system NtrC family sensor kinase
MICPSPTRVLVVDDNSAIHMDFGKILTRPPVPLALDELERLALGPSARTAEAAAEAAAPMPVYEIDSAFQGAEALACVQTAVNAQRQYALAFVDMRMPPGWDGLQTIEKLWSVDPGLQVVICSAYSDYDWDEVLARLKRPDMLLVIKKPFDEVEVLQCANALTAKWHSERKLRTHLALLEETIQARTASLEAINEQLREQMRLRQAAEMELRLAQKLEAVGRLAAGIAHEINTPIQYITDSVNFLGSAFDELLAAIAYGPVTLDASRSADIVFLREEVPRAIERTIEGTERVATIVRAMKEFSHPDASEKMVADVNRALQNTLMIACNEYKYVATVDLQCGELPEVMCNVGELSQVFLNLIVNSAHALADAGRDTETGRITIKTAEVDGCAEFTFEDNGCGIPQEILDKIYDPFFTTKEVGRGTGQGLAIARAIVVDKHSGSIEVRSTPGEGTCFTLRLPINGTSP